MVVMFVMSIPVVRDLRILDQEMKAHKPDGYELPHVKFFLSALVMTIVCFILRRLSRMAFKGFYLRNMKPELEGEIREKRAKRGAEYVY